MITSATIIQCVDPSYQRSDVGGVELREDLTIGLREDGTLELRD